MKNVINMIKSLLRLARTTKVGDDTADFPVQQVGYLGKVGDSVMWFPYGMHANVSVDELVLMLSVQGNPEARISIPGSPQKRVKPLAASEVVFFHPDTGSKLHFKANGDIEIVSFSGSKQIFKVNGDIEIDSQRDVNIRVVGNALVDVEGTMTTNVAGAVVIDYESTLTETAEDDVTKVVTGGDDTLTADTIKRIANVNYEIDSPKIIIGDSNIPDDVLLLLSDLIDLMRSALHTGGAGIPLIALKARADAMRT